MLASESFRVALGTVVIGFYVDFFIYIYNPLPQQYISSLSTFLALYSTGFFILAHL